MSRHHDQSEQCVAKGRSETEFPMSGKNSQRSGVSDHFQKGRIHPGLAEGSDDWRGI
jgi:hypothetical protein